MTNRKLSIMIQNRKAQVCIDDAAQVLRFQKMTWNNGWIDSSLIVEF